MMLSILPLVCRCVMAASQPMGPSLTDGQQLHLPEFHDSVLTRVVVSGDGIAAALYAGIGQSCYDSRFYLDSADGPPQVLTMGVNSELAKEGNAYHEGPALVIPVDAHTYLFNMRTGRSFPDPELHAKGIAGNVILFDSSSGELTNLTRLDEESGSIAQVLAWFEADQIALVVYSNARGLDARWPEVGTENEQYINLHGTPMGQAEDFPSASTLFQAWSRLRVEGQRSGDRCEWLLRDGDESCRLWTSVDEESPEVFLLDVHGERALATSVGKGTWICNVGASTRRQVSPYQTLSVDAQANRWVLRDDVSGMVFCRQLPKDALGDGQATEELCTNVAPLRCVRLPGGVDAGAGE